MKIKITMRYYNIPVRMAKIQKADNKVVAVKMQSNENLNSLLMRMQNGTPAL